MGKTEVMFYVSEARKSDPEFLGLVLVVGLLEAAPVIECIQPLVRNFPSIGDRASMIICVLNISSGVSSGGGNAITIDFQSPLSTMKVAIITINPNIFTAFPAFTLAIS